MHMRLKTTLFNWIIAKADEAQMYPSTYAQKVLEEAAQRDLLKGDPDGVLSPASHA
jgi:hypothetical protein